MHARSLLITTSLLSVLCSFAQEPGVKPGKPFQKTIKGSSGGDLQFVIGGLAGTDGRAVLFVQEGLAHKLVRLDASLQPTDEVALSQIAFDGKKWDGITPIINGNEMHVLFVSNGKKSCDLAVANVELSGPLTVSTFQKVATFDQPFTFDPEIAISRKSLPDLIIYDNGAAYDHTDRVAVSPDGSHYLIDYCTRDTKGNKKFWYAVLNKDFTAAWSGVKDLPFPDSRSKIHQVMLDNNGRIILLTYVFTCASPEQMSDKQCHEMHLTVLDRKGEKMKDMLVDKDFVSSARACVLSDGGLMLGVRYGALTGQAGELLRIDTAITKLKNTPLVDQRVPAIHKVKLTTFGSPDADPKKKTSASRATAKTPDEIVDVLPAWDGGALLIEEFHDPEMQINVGDAIAMRHLNGAIRATYVDAHDSIRWQQTVDRAFMTTAGEAFESIGYSLNNDGLLIAYNTTPGGLAAINAPAEVEGDAKKSKKDKTPVAEPSALHVAMIGRDGKMILDKSVMIPPKGFTECPMSLVTNADHSAAWISSFDRDKSHNYLEVDPAVLVK